MIDRKKLGEKILILRRRLSITQRELGCLIDMKQKSISDYENGTHCPDLHSLEKLSRFFEVPMAHFVDDSESFYRFPRSHTYDPHTPKEYWHLTEIVAHHDDPFPPPTSSYCSSKEQALQVVKECGYTSFRLYRIMISPAQVVRIICGLDDR